MSEPNEMIPSFTNEPYPGEKLRLTEEKNNLLLASMVTSCMLNMALGPFLECNSLHVYAVKRYKNRLSTASVGNMSKKKYSYYNSLFILKRTFITGEKNFD